MHRAEFGSAVSPIMTMPHFALILEITPLKFNTLSLCTICYCFLGPCSTDGGRPGTAMSARDGRETPMMRRGTPNSDRYVCVMGCYPKISIPDHVKSSFTCGSSPTLEITLFTIYHVEAERGAPFRKLQFNTFILHILSVSESGFGVSTWIRH